MENSSIEYLGYVAGILTTFGMLPQIITLFKTKEHSGISLGYFLTLFVGVVLWEIYGILTAATPIIIANFVTGLFLFIIIAQVVYLRRKDNE